MGYKQTYEKWINDVNIDKEIKNELLSIKDNEKEIEERFYKDLEFGTGGLRGIIGAGTNRMNIYTVRRASQGLAAYIKSNLHKNGKDSVVIAYDSRYKSSEFALEAAKVFAANGLKAFLFDELRPTPELSFAVRHLKAAAGVVVTASHNPPQYNGYKVYGEDGGQITIDTANAIIKEINAIMDITSVKTMDKDEALEKGLIKIIGKEIDDVYIEKLKTLRINPHITMDSDADIKIIYTPLHGTGNKLVRRILKETGYNDVIVVKEQEMPDPSFSTVKSPNPEEKDAFKLAIEMAEKENADLIIGTDPDCDRIGVVVKNLKGEYQVLTGNQTGCLLMDYILSGKSEKNQLPKNGFVVKTIVTTELVKRIAESFNVELIEVLTGFKFIGEKIKELDDQGDKKYIFGFEESYGYLAGTFARDKDGVVAAMLIAEMTAYYKAKNMSLYEGLDELYKKYGYYVEDINSFTLEGKEGMEKIKNTLKELRDDKVSKFGKFDVYAVRDYLVGKRYVIDENKVQDINLPQSNVLYYEMADGSWFCIRPSGTEPKLKLYYGVSADTLKDSRDKLIDLKECVLSRMEKMLYE